MFKESASPVTKNRELCFVSRCFDAIVVKTEKTVTWSSAMVDSQDLFHSMLRHMHDRPIHIIRANRGGEGSRLVWGKWMVLRVQPDIFLAGGFEPTIGAQCNTLDLSLVPLSKDHSWRTLICNHGHEVYHKSNWENWVWFPASVSCYAICMTCTTDLFTSCMLIMVVREAHWYRENGWCWESTKYFVSWWLWAYCSEHPWPKLHATFEGSWLDLDLPWGGSQVQLRKLSFTACYMYTICMTDPFTSYCTC